MDLEQRFSRGDAGAFESLFHAHQREVFQWINRIVRDPSAAEDLTVESFWRAYQARGTFDPSRGGFAPWMRRIAVNAALKHIARRRIEIPIGDHAAASARPPVEEGTGRVQHALRRLSPALQAVVLLGVVEEEPYADIAAALGISLSAVKSRMSRALGRLRKEVKDES